MAKEKEEKKKFTDQDIVANILKDNKADHFNFLEDRYYKVSTSSMLMDHIMEGGLPPGLHRFTGPSECGKTKASVDTLANFLKLHEKGKGVYVEAEGRLPRSAFEQHGIKPVYKAEDWEYGTCFVFQSNVYEVVADLIDKLILREGDDFYCFILDSVDGLMPRAAKLKAFDESHQVAGGAVIASNLMKRVAIPMAKRGHVSIFLSQQRATISIDPYAPKDFKLFQGSGGNALVHYSNYILNFEPRYKKDLIIEDASKPITPDNQALGHYAKVTIKKSPNERTGMLVKYPVKYRKKVGSSVWIEKEVIDTLLMWEEITRRGAWYSFSDGIKSVLEEGSCDFPETMQGLAAVYEAVESSKCAIPILKKYLYENLMQRS